jgi:hypothetical protein
MSEGRRGLGTGTGPQNVVWEQPDEWMDPDRTMVVLTTNEKRVIWNAVTSLRRRTTVAEIADTCSAIRAKLALTPTETSEP